MSRLLYCLDVCKNRYQSQLLPPPQPNNLTRRNRKKQHQESQIISVPTPPAAAAAAAVGTLASNNNNWIRSRGTEVLPGEDCDCHAGASVFQATSCH
ncbi:hypothetical protein Pcinc_033867 [Petrolisthes cinctipes]|uniref:Uncharacterized protein n=1 Tax=Petrolisthes cinctipes TaxID=88211 RepID=A0AAE1ERJ0_PETCI|nr:hypothetical protein Pcinc_040798 [Petrolisthes cinctipes]KAK3860056.1 hypothetical protein Pcinc_033867 [Petrolisthes cinctipes]